MLDQVRERLPRSFIFTKKNIFKNLIQQLHCVCCFSRCVSPKIKILAFAGSKTVSKIKNTCAQTKEVKIDCIIKAHESVLDNPMEVIRPCQKSNTTCAQT